MKALKKILSVTISTALAVAFCVPLAATEALASAASQVILPLSADGGSGDVILCVESDRAAAVKTASANTCQWTALMSVDATSVAKILTGTTTETADQNGYQLVELKSSTTSTKAIVSWAQGIEGVELAQKNAATEVASTSQDVDDDDDASDRIEPTSYYDSTKPLSTYSNYAWFLNNAGTIADGKQGFDIDVPSNVTCTSDEVVAVIDGGIAYDNPALEPYMIDLSAYANGPALMASTGANKYGICTVTGKATTDNYDANGHGTHCAGIITQVATQGGTKGSISLMDVRAGDEEGYFSDASLIKACQFVIKAREAGVNVVAANMSLGGAGFLNDGQRIAVTQMAQCGVACAVASGNTEADGDTIPDSVGSYNINGLLLVGASQPDGTMSTYTTYGARSVNVIAPGTCIYSTFNRAGAQFVNQIAVQNTLQGVTDSSQALYNEGFEVAGSAGAAQDPNIGNSVGWSYATCEVDYDDDGNAKATIKATGKALQYSTTHKFQGTRSLVMPSGESAALVSQPFSAEILAKAETIDLNLWTSDDQSSVDFFFVDENGTVYGEGEYSRACIKRGWVGLNSQALELLPKSVRAAALAGHQIRLVLTSQGQKSTTAFCVDDICLGYGVDGYAMLQGTSMATPAVAGAFAVLTAALPNASATELACRICGGSTYSASLNAKCTSSGFLNVTGALDPRPAIQSTSVNKNILTINGYFFGEKQGTVKIGSTTATVDSWSRISGDFYSVSVDVPGTVVKGNNTIWITSASGKTGRTVISLAAFKAQNTFKTFPSMPQLYNDRFSDAVMCATKKTLYIFGTNLNDDDDNDKTELRAGQIQVVGCSLSTKTYHNKGIFKLGTVAGFKSNPSIENAQALTISGVPYLCGTLGSKYCVFKYLHASNKFKLVLKTSCKIAGACKKGSKLYLVSEATVNKGKCKIGKMRSWKKGTYVAVRKVNLKKGSLKFVGGMRIGSVDDFKDYRFCMAGGRLVSLAEYGSRVYTTTCKVSKLSVKHPAKRSCKKLTGMAREGSTYIATVGKRVAYVNAYKKKSADPSCCVFFFNPATNKWSKDNTMISPYDIDFVSLAAYGTTLYVRAQESATINPHINFISSYTY